MLPLFSLAAVLCLLSPSDVEEKGSVPGCRGIRTEWRRDVVVEGGWGQRETDPSIRGYNEREQLPAAGQTAHRCEGASGPDRAEGDSWSPSAMTSFSESGLPLTPAPLPVRRQALHRLKTKIIHVFSSPVRRIFWADLPLCCFAKLWPTWRGTACQRLISASPPLPGTRCRVKYYHGWLNFLSFGSVQWGGEYIKSSVYFSSMWRGQQKCQLVSWCHFHFWTSCPENCKTKSAARSQTSNLNNFYFFLSQIYSINLFYFSISMLYQL